MFVDYVQGDVVFMRNGPYAGVCAVVREIDVDGARLLLEIPLGPDSRGVIAGFDEVERA